MSTPNGRPDALELIEAVREFLDDEVKDAVHGQLAFHVRVAANALAISLRELKAAPNHQRVHASRLAQFDCSDDAGLAAAILRGELDERYDELRVVLRSMARDKINITNPRYVEE